MHAPALLLKGLALSALLVATASASPCKSIENTDRPGNDLTNVPGKVLSDCDAACKANDACVTFVWSNHNGGTCWLKSDFGATVEKAGVTATDCGYHSPSTKCGAVANKDRLGFDFLNVPGNVDQCDVACFGNKNCVTWTWSNHNGGTCWLKSRAGELIDKAGVTATTCTYLSQSTVCAPYTDIDFVGMDIGNKPAASADKCCDICNAFSGCTAYAWNGYNGGTCYLKNSVGHVIAKSGVVSGSLVFLNGPVCPFEYDTDFEGNDVGNKPAKDAGVCCSQCKETAACKAYSWSNYNGGTCWMKSGKGKAISKAGVISAKLAYN